MKYVYKFIAWVLFEVITFLFGAGYGIKWLDKKRAEQTAPKSEPVITKTENKDRNDGRKRVVGFSYDEAES